ncbi:hypothetical protein LPJ61_001807 [Coemansia biformis]|uniref:MFS general substrate transporter n=1 Tax=Coemansia biformis TaxID=1286918 RepID=A0A9W7YEH2_9FUNG|nr:hypothetical protein LPJ61_001807 [Coemansia biformis]
MVLRMGLGQGMAPAGKRRWRQGAKAYPKGMGNLVVFCSFAALALGPGLLNAYGVYEEEYDRLFDRKDESHEWSQALGSPVIFIGVVQILLANGMGFIGGHCAQRFGPGPAVFAGGLLMAAGLFAASFSREIWQLCLSQGVLFGLGVCLTWIPAASSPSSWFSKNRGLATGITHMGLGIGGLVFSPLTRFLLEKTGTSGSLRWLALVVLVGVSVVSMGIHAKQPDRPMSDIVVSSARWSKCLDDQESAVCANGYDSDTMNYEEYRRASVLARAQDASHGKSILPPPLLLPANEEEHAGLSSEEEHTGLSSEEERMGLPSVPEAMGAGSTAAAEDVNEKPEMPRHVRFVPETARRAALDKLEGLSHTRERQQQRRASGSGLHSARTQERRYAAAGQPSPSPPVGLGKAQPYAASEPGPRSVTKSWRFWLLSLGIGTGQASWYIVLLFMPSIGVSAGLDVHNAAIVLGSINGASAVGQFAAGYVADLIGPINALLSFTFVATIANSILFVPHLSLHLLLAYSCLCGASIGAADPLAVMAGITQFGRARAATTTGLIYGSVGVLVTITAPTARVLQHKTAEHPSFVRVYILVIAMFATSTLLLALLRLRISRSLFVRA